MKQNQSHMYRAKMYLRSTICRRRSNIIKIIETNQIDHLETSQNAKIFKTVEDYKQIWIARFRLIWLARKLEFVWILVAAKRL